jgi:hypothetical protein
MYAHLVRSLALATLAVGFAAVQAQGQSKGTSICKDGTSSTVTGKGACSGHGGVDSVATSASRKAAKAAKAEAKVDKAANGKDPAKKAKAAAKATVANEKADKAEAKAAKDSVGATALCKDGTYSHAVLVNSQCTAHGGVAKTFKQIRKP